MSEAPRNPAGEYDAGVARVADRRAEWIGVIEDAPTALQGVVAGLSEAQLDARYRDWTIRQIVHHLADSHVNSYIRFKWALTEENPTIKAYDEGRWAALEDSRAGEVRSALALLEGLHARWVQLLRSMTEDQFARSFTHPETGRAVSLGEALGYYAWHSRHHTAQIRWLRESRGW